MKKKKITTRIEHIVLHGDFDNHYKYILEEGLRIDMVKIIMKLNGIINRLNELGNKPD